VKSQISETYVSIASAAADGLHAAGDRTARQSYLGPGHEFAIPPYSGKFILFRNALKRGSAWRLSSGNQGLMRYSEKSF